MQDTTPWISSAVVFDDRRAGRDSQSLLREFGRQVAEFISATTSKGRRRDAAIGIGLGHLRTRLLQRWLNSRSRIDRWQKPRLASLQRHAAKHVAFYREFRNAAFSDLPVIGKREVMDRFEDFNRLGLTASQIWAMIDRGEAPAGYDVGCSTGTSGNQGV